MKKSSFTTILIPVLLSQLMAWSYVLVYVPLAYIYDTFPGQDALVMTIATAPGIVAMVSSFLAAAISNKVGYKNMVVISLAAMFGGAMMVRFLGPTNIWFAIIGSGMVGFPAGTIPTANYAILGEIAPSDMRSKVVGWCDAATGVGTILCNFMAGILSANGSWSNVYSYYFIVIPITALTLLFYPSTSAIKRMSQKTDEATGEIVEEADFVPKGIKAMMVLTFVMCLFHLIPQLYRSSLIISEYQMGNSLVVGNIASVCGVAAALGSGLIFLMLKKFKGFTVTAGLILMGVVSLVMSLVSNLPLIAVMCVLNTFGMQVHNSGLSTVISMGPKGKIRARYTGTFMGLMYLGEFLSGYIAPIIAKLFHLNGLPSIYVRIGAIALIILGVVCLPFYHVAYAACFPDKEKTAADAA